MSIGSYHVDDNLRFNYTGTVREVLNNIGADLGFTFFYDPGDNSIKFASLNSGIDINVKNIETGSNKNKIISKSHRKSRENSKSVWGNSVFARDAEQKSYSCSGGCRKLVMQCLTLDDLLPDALHCEALPSTKGSQWNRLEFMSALAHRISPEFRDLIVWYIFYELKTGRN